MEDAAGEVAVDAEPVPGEAVRTGTGGDAVLRDLEGDAVCLHGPRVDLCQGLNLRRGPLLGLCVVQPALSLDRDRRVVALEVGVRLVGGVHVLLDGAVLADVHVTIGYSLLIEVTKQRGCLTDRHVQVDAPVPAHSAAGLRGDGLTDRAGIPGHRVSLRSVRVRT